MVLLHNSLLNFDACLCQNWFCEVTVASTDVKNLKVCWFPFSQKSVLFCWTIDTTCTLLGPFNPPLQFYARCNSNQKNLQMFLLQTFFPRTLYICWDVLQEVFTSLQDKESSMVDNLHFQFDKKLVWYPE